MDEEVLQQIIDNQLDTFEFTGTVLLSFNSHTMEIILLVMKE
jgi:hypothetical protein